MGQGTKIAWATDTWNAWIGCSKVSEECANCYAADMDARRFSRTLGAGTSADPVSHWGPGAPRHFTKSGNEPLAWNRRPWICDGCGKAHSDAERGVYCCDATMKSRRRVFCGSLMDWADEEVMDEKRDRLFDVAERCEDLLFLFLTKRPENARRYLLNRYRGKIPEHFWGGLSWMHNQPEAIMPFLDTPWFIRFLSFEPMLAPLPVGIFRGASIKSQKYPEGFVDLSKNEKRRWYDDAARATYISRCLGIHWAIIGGESGDKARPLKAWWVKQAIETCQDAGVALFVKQMGSNVVDRNDAGYEGDGPLEWPMDTHTQDLDPQQYQGAPLRVMLKDKKGGDPAEWPEAFRIRELPV